MASMPLWFSYLCDWLLHVMSFAIDLLHAKVDRLHTRYIVILYYAGC